ncbi:MAG: tyrosinase family protein [Bacteroidota bacterium]
MDRREFTKKVGVTIAGIPLASSMIEFATKQESVRLRKNIESLSPDELANYKHALTILKERKNNEENSFYSLAQMHNTSDFQYRCQHGNDLFLPWHRGMLYYFEQELQKTDPPRTSNVTIPYYDFTKIPSIGNRFPAVFEDINSILGMRWSRRGWTANNRAVNSSGNTPPLIAPRGINDLMNLNWIDFGGKVGSPGKIEKPHNTMHNTGIGGVLRSTYTAAYDPLFWSFHTFIDLIFWRWQRESSHSIPQGRFDEKMKFQGMWDDMKFGDAIDVEALGYRYEYQTEELFTADKRLAFFGAAQAEGSFSQNNPFIAGLANRSKINWTNTFSLKPMKNQFSKAVFKLTDFVHLEDHNITGFIYLHPSSEKFNPRSPLFIERYLVDYLSIFGMKSMGGMEMKSDYSFDLTGEMRRVTQLAKSEMWTISLALSIERLSLSKELDNTKSKPVSKSAAEQMIKIRNAELQYIN